MMKIRREYLCLLLLIPLASCKKTETLPAGLYLSKVIYHQKADQVRYYYYNSNGLLIKRDFQFIDKIAERFEYGYQEGQLSNISCYEYDNNVLSYANSLQFDYQSGNLAKSTLLPGGDVSTYNWDNNRVVRVVQSSSKMISFVYGNDGNIKEADIYQDNKFYEKLLYKYDNMHNPFYNLDPIHDSYPAIDFIHYQCPNNVTKSTLINENKDTVSVSDFVYQYNSNDLPVKCDKLYTSKSNGYEKDSTAHLIYVYNDKK